MRLLPSALALDRHVQVAASLPPSCWNGAWGIPFRTWRQEMPAHGLYSVLDHLYQRKNAHIEEVPLRYHFISSILSFSSSLLVSHHTLYSHEAQHRIHPRVVPGGMQCHVPRSLA